jgi:electron transport complex protein RnfG
MGYADVIKVLYGYSFEKQAVVGLKVLESKETPGLGDKIQKDPGFRENFIQLDVGLAANGTELAHPIEVKAHGTKSSPWQIDAITGATISSNAIGDLLGKSTTRWMPLLAPRRADFQE